MSTIPAFSSAATSGYGPRGQILAGAAQARERLDMLTRQAGSGRVADTFGGLAGGAATSLALRPELSRLEGWQANIAAAEGRMDVTLTALDQIGGIASDFRARIADLNGLDAGTVDSVAAAARDALRQVAGLLNTRQGGQYVFAGQDGANAPVPQADNILASGFATQIVTAVAGLGSNGADATIAATLAVATSNAAGISPFSAGQSRPAAALRAQAATVSVGEGRHVETGVPASANAEATSGGDGTTGSYMRDILRALATLGAMDGSQLNTPGFAALAEDVRAGLESAVTALGVDAGLLGNRQADLREQADRLDATASTLRARLAGAEDVDMAETLSALSLAQTRLQASYQLLAGLPSLSLLKFLPAG
jgi:flagellin-like hook-associated protein FlgL